MKRIELNTSQRRVFDYITKHGSITILQSITELGETRLSARIYELRDKGVHILTSWVNVHNRFGEKRRVKRYSIG